MVSVFAIKGVFIGLLGFHFQASSRTKLSKCPDLSEAALVVTVVLRVFAPMRVAFIVAMADTTAAAAHHAVSVGILRLQNLIIFLKGN